MPGLVLAVGNVPFERFRAATAKLEHIPSHRSHAVQIVPGLSIGWAGMPERAEHCAGEGEAGDVHVWRYGHSFADDRAPATVGAQHILSDYLTRGIEACFDYDGSFVIVIADLRSRRIYVVPDRLSTLPLNYARRGDDIAVGPEVKAVTSALSFQPKLSAASIAGFLVAGYNIGAQTVFRGVARLELGKMLEITLDLPRKLRVRRFWKLDFANAEKIVDRRDAEDALFEAIKQGHRLLLADAPQFQLLLSGGADSRGILGTCRELRCMPQRAIAWGLLSDVPRSDPAISKALAERFGVPWDFIVTRTDGFVENCEQWAYVSELSNDNFGWYTEGLGTLNYMHDMGYACSFIGDESWGWQGFAYDEMQAYGKVLAPRIPPSLLALIRASQRERVAEEYVANIHEVMRDCDASDWNDRKDFLYLHARVARFIFALGYNRGHATEQRRPFLTRAVLDVVRRLPSDLRVHKNLYRTMLRRHLTDTTRVPYASVDSLPDWGYDLRTRGALKDCFSSLVNDPSIESGVLGELLDARQFRALRDAYFGQVPTPVVRTARTGSVVKAQMKEMLWRNPGYKYLDRWMNEHSGVRTQCSTVATVDVLRRIAIVVLLERQLGKFQTT